MDEAASLARTFAMIDRLVAEAPPPGDLLDEWMLGPVD